MTKKTTLDNLDDGESTQTTLAFVWTVSDSDSDNELFDTMDLAPVRKKMGLIPELERGKMTF